MNGKHADAVTPFFGSQAAVALPFLGATPFSINDALKEFIDLTEQKRALAEQQRALQARLDSLTPNIIFDFCANDKQSENRNGYCVYLGRNVSIKAAGAGETADIVDVLRKARLGELIGLNWPRVRAWIKERMYCAATDTWEINLKKLPPSLRGVVEISEFYRLNCRKS